MKQGIFIDDLYFFLIGCACFFAFPCVKASQKIIRFPTHSLSNLASVFFD
jgi:hypothetical protein